MKQYIKIFAFIAPVLLLLGAFFKTNHWPGANILIAVGALASILLFILMISSFLGKLATGFERFNGIFVSLALIVSLLALMFKVMHWPGAATVIWFADIGILLSGIFLLIDALLEKDLAKWRLKIIAMFFVIFVFLMVVLAG
ncbi:MAG: hypothetical protein KKA81_15760 [Bacteroidetes bacterium]|nr:hypothetical protein [Bacteroidota bacterium]